MKLKKIILIILAVLLAAEVGVLFFLGGREDDVTIRETEPAMTEMTEPSDSLPAEDASEPGETVFADETEVSTEPDPTEKDDNTYILTFVGDCTLGSTKKNWNNSNHFIQVNLAFIKPHSFI